MTTSRSAKRCLGTLALLTTLALPAQAQVAFEPGVGGSISRERVQSAFGWRDRQVRVHGEKVTFSYEMTDWYAVTCTTKTEEGEAVESTSTVSRSTTLGVVSVPKFEEGREGRRQIYGYDLMGYTEGESVTGNIPSVDDTCQGHGGAEGRVIRSELEHVRDTLYVNQGEMKVGIWFESY
jgi:hypothetical protein